MTFRLGSVAHIWPRVRRCFRKESFGTEAQALGQMEALYRSRKADLGTLNVYRCGVCRRFHVGHPRYAAS